jgi:heme-degrading monooxygenase HmoA
MWAQLIKARIKPGHEEEVDRVQKEFESRGRNDASIGWVRSMTLRNQADPQEIYSLVFFESEEKARENERRPEHQALTSQMGNAFEGSPSFVNLVPHYEASR